MHGNLFRIFGGKHMDAVSENERYSNDASACTAYDYFSSHLYRWNIIVYPVVRIYNGQPSDKRRHFWIRTSVVSLPFTNGNNFFSHQFKSV